MVSRPSKKKTPSRWLVLQLRKRGIDNVILAGMSANLCVENHLRELIEQGFDVTVVKDATAPLRRPQRHVGTFFDLFRASVPVELRRAWRPRVPRHRVLGTASFADRNGPRNTPFRRARFLAYRAPKSCTIW